MIGEWVRWLGGEWKLPPDTLVHVKFYGNPDLCDDNLPALPASHWGIGNVPSNWRGPSARIDEYRIVKPERSFQR